MILTVTLNAALDVTYVVDALLPRSSHRVTTTHERAGGKGLNVARVLHTLGRETTVTGLAGGPTGQLIRDDLHAAGLRDALVEVAGDARRTLTVVSREDGDATVFNQSGPQVGDAEWAEFRTRYGQLARTARVVVLSGSLPPGVPTDAYGQLVRLAGEAGAATVLDSSGTALLAALGARPDVIKPNVDELTAATGRAELPAAAAELRDLGARAVVASAGPEGLYALTPDGSWRATPPRALAGNPTGAGDACVAALAAGLADGTPWPDMLRESVALSAAAVVRPVAGEFDAGVHQSFATTVTVVPVEDPYARSTH